MKINGLRWWIIGLIALATIINYIDRGTLGILWPEIAKDIGLSESDSKNAYATISLFFLITYAFSKGLSGRIFDVIGTRMGFVASITIWSVAAMLHAVAKGTASFSAFRALLGIGEAGNWPGAAKANAEWFPVKERALAQGIFNSGASIGAIISAPLIAYLFTLIGWRGTFFATGAIGLLWIIPWMFLNRGKPGDNMLLTKEEREYIFSDRPKKENNIDDGGLGWSQLLKYKESWGILIARFMLDPIWWLFVIWLPIYLNDAFGFNVKEIGAFAWVPYVGAALGSIFGGYIAQVFITRGWTVNRTRKSIIFVSGIFMLVGLLLGAQASDPTIAMILIALVLFGFQMAIGNIQTMPADYFAGNSVGTLAGLGGTAAAIGTIILSTYLVPALTEVSYTPVFLMGAALVPIGIGALFILGGNISKIDVE